ALISFVQADVLDLDLSGASVVTAYLSQDLLEKLTPAFKRMKDGSRIVSHGRLIPGAQKDEGFPIEVVKKNGYGALVYRSTTPRKVEDCRAPARPLPAAAQRRAPVGRLPQRLGGRDRRAAQPRPAAARLLRDAAGDGRRRGRDRRGRHEKGGRRGVGRSG